MINWKVRIRNRHFWLTMIPAALLCARSVAALFGVCWVLTGLQEQLLAVVDAVFTLLAVLGVVNDPTTRGLGDSERAMGYDMPD